MEIDLVLPYVDSSKVRWQKLHNETCKKLKRQVSEPQRYRPTIDLKYQLRLLEKHCGFIRTVFLVVQDRTQIPNYIKESEYLKVVEHKEIIPEELLPTYNSGTIELFIHRIPDLSEHFIYINDDMYPLNDLSESDFFDGNSPKINVVVKEQTSNKYRRMLKNSEMLVRSILNKPIENKKMYFLRDGHSFTPMIKSHWELLFKERYHEIVNSCSTFREPKNMVQQLVTYYEYLTDNLKSRDIITKYYTYNEVVSSVADIFNHKADIVCINDSLNNDFGYYRNTFKIIFNKIASEKSSKYEI